MEQKIDKWDYAPPDATHYAVDADGRGWWYFGEPEFNGRQWCSPTRMTLGDDREYWRAAAAHSLEARPVQSPRPHPLEPVAVRKADRDTPEDE